MIIVSWSQLNFKKIYLQMLFQGKSWASQILTPSNPVILDIEIR